MKAREMADKYRQTPTEELLKEFLLDMIKEIKTIMDQRGGKSNSALVAVLRQQDDKWKAFCRLCTGVNPDAFKKAAHSVTPAVREIWP